MQTIQKLIKWNPAALKAKAIKFFAGLGIVFVLVASSYMVGVHNTNNSWETKQSTASVALANLQAKNAREAAQRFGEQVKQQAALKAAIDAAKGEVHDYYKNNPVDPRVVEKTKLVQVPGKEEYVYVPFGICPNDLFNDDELRLYNKGNKGSDSDAGNPK